MIGKNEQVVSIIREFITSQKKEKNIVNEIIRDDVFAILRNECVVLYYALDDSKIEGCHVIKPLNGRMEQFVFINTTKAIQEQTWTAAHELGHVWKVDSYVKEKLGQYDLDSEDLVNRFAAELLPKQILKGFEEQKELYKRLIVENQYTRLETVNRAFSMASMEKDIVSIVSYKDY